MMQHVYWRSQQRMCRTSSLFRLPRAIDVKEPEGLPGDGEVCEIRCLMSKIAQDGSAE